MRSPIRGFAEFQVRFKDNEPNEQDEALVSKSDHVLFAALRRGSVINKCFSERRV